MSKSLGEFDEFALECIVHDRDDAGVVYETLYENLPGNAERMYLVQFLDEAQPRVVQANTGGGEQFVIEAELDPHEKTDAHSLMECVQGAIDGSGLSVVQECGSTRYYIVSRFDGGDA